MSIRSETYTSESQSVFRSHDEESAASHLLEGGRHRLERALNKLTDSELMARANRVEVAFSDDLRKKIILKIIENESIPSLKTPTQI
jgi:hypothetical protein